ncbi:hypothetical protein, partial [Pseudomonas sp. BDAL1]
DRAGKTRACLTAGPNQPEHKKTDTPVSTDAFSQSRRPEGLSAVIACTSAISPDTWLSQQQSILAQPLTQTKTNGCRATTYINPAAYNPFVG